MSNEVRLNGIYRHYRTLGLYTPMAIVKNTGDGENDKMMVLYYSFSARELFTRPLNEFVAMVPNGDGRSIPRFQHIDDLGVR